MQLENLPDTIKLFECETRSFTIEQVAPFTFVYVHLPIHEAISTLARFGNFYEQMEMALKLVLHNSYRVFAGFERSWCPDLTDQNFWRYTIAPDWGDGNQYGIAPIRGGFQLTNESNVNNRTYAHPFGNYISLSGAISYFSREFFENLCRLQKEQKLDDQNRLSVAQLLGTVRVLILLFAPAPVNLSGLEENLQMLSGFPCEVCLGAIGKESDIAPFDEIAQNASLAGQNRRLPLVATGEIKNFDAPTGIYDGVLSLLRSINPPGFVEVLVDEGEVYNGIHERKNFPYLNKRIHVSLEVKKARVMIEGAEHSVLKYP